MVHLSKRCCYSDRWVWVRIVRDVFSLQFLLVSMSEINNCRTVLYFPRSFFIDFLPFSDCQNSNYLLSYSGFFWHILLYKYSTQYVSWKNNYVFFHTKLFNSGYFTKLSSSNILNINFDSYY